jgi:hypothetical protein
MKKDEEGDESPLGVSEKPTRPLGRAYCHGGAVLSHVRHEMKKKQRKGQSEKN